MPSAADKGRWDELAKQAKTPLSKWIIATVEESLAEKEGMRPRSDLIKTITALEDENKSLREDLKLKTVVIERYDEELRRLRAVPFTEDGFKGVRAYSSELVELLKTRGNIDGYALLDALGIGATETEAIKAINTQLEELERFGFVEPTGRGWTWKG